MDRHVLDGTWRLAYRGPEHRKGPYAAAAGPAFSSGEVPARVPGNVELDLSRAGVLPADLFRGEAILSVRELEDHEWWYSTSFQLAERQLARRPELAFHGVDGDAEYLLNGVLLGRSASSLIEHRLAIGAAARVGDNELVVHLRPMRPGPEAAHLAPLWALGEPLREESVWVRKAAHAYGWDIMPRALSAGIWRSVELVEHDEVEISALYLATTSAGEGGAALRAYYEIGGAFERGAPYELVVTGTCGESGFRLVQEPATRTGAIAGKVDSPRLWWPRGYGAPDLYEVTAELRRDGAVLASRSERCGIRTVELLRSATAPGRPGEFRFDLNGTPVYCRGTNWVPVDVFHSRDAESLPERLGLLSASGSNMVRCWGGNVYESDAFYDYCDANGIMVWQDFSLACAVYPQGEPLRTALAEEVASVARRLRRHPSLVLWCGDNEGDQLGVPRGIRPELNRLTRRTIPDALHAQDPHRPYIPSSPFIAEESEEVMRSGDLRFLPETHLWGTRDYYKSDFYRGATAAFVSEIGFMGLPDPSSLRRFLDEEALWPHENRQWLVHGTDPTVDFGSRFWWRTVMTLECVRVFFGELPELLDDAVLASQIVQAEGFKYAIESARQRKWSRTGVLWWNLADGWPQISDAVVDYYLTKKLAFDYIARSQRDAVLLVGEPDGDRYPLIACNDTRRLLSGTFRVVDAESGSLLLEGAYVSPANEATEIGELRLADRQSLLLVDWQDEDGAAGNHYLTGSPPFELSRYRKWLAAIGRDPRG